ncbi:MAG TPA: hypothetical protein VFF52_21850 [Isosphaeraceae bacterium]|nr:hypothetical protein [Isosphaeraceae bacterium]
MSHPLVYADFQNADTQGRLRLNCIGTVRDLARQKIALRAGLELTLYDEELEVGGEVLFSQEESVWVAVIDWEASRPKRGVHADQAQRPSSVT